MRSIVTFSPFHELHRFADMMDRMWDSDQLPTGMGVPMDVWEQDNHIFIKASLPGIDPKQIDLSVENDILTISGEFCDKHEDPNNNRRMVHREVRYGNFTRSISLPKDADQDHIDADYDNGFLTVKVPRKQAPPNTQPKKLEIHTHAESGASPR